MKGISFARNLYKPTIGIECHVQLNTKTKLFAPVSNESRGAAPNTRISHICAGMPGALPILNKTAVEYAVRTGIALSAVINMFSKFERKHYFYPDLPKGYQISQYEQPIIGKGSVTIHISDTSKKIRINRVQLEEDAGKNTHPEGAEYSLVDLNRAGTPLLEIVSEPDIASGAEAKAYAKELYLLIKYAGISDVDLYHGNMRFDVNVSVSKTSKLGTRSEVKNLNSFKSVENAVNFEIERQIALLEKGEKIVQETRGWNEAKQKTFSQRDKEEAHDYRYMPDPDIPPIILDANDIERIKASMPQLPQTFREELKGIGIDSKTIEDILFTPEIAVITHRIYVSSGKVHARRIAFWLLQEQPDSSQNQPWLQNLTDDQLLKLSNMVEDGQLSSTAAKKVLHALSESGGDVQEIAGTLNILQMSAGKELDAIVTQVITDCAKAVEDVRNGEMKAVGFLVGQVMKASQGKANPEVVQSILKEKLGLKN